MYIAKPGAGIGDIPVPFGTNGSWRTTCVCLRSRWVLPTFSGTYRLHRLYLRYAMDNRNHSYERYNDHAYSCTSVEGRVSVKCCRDEIQSCAISKSTFSPKGHSFGRGKVSIGGHGSQLLSI